MLRRIARALFDLDREIMQIHLPLNPFRPLASLQIDFFQRNSTSSPRIALFGLSRPHWNTLRVGWPVYESEAGRK